MANLSDLIASNDQSLAKPQWLEAVGEKPQFSPGLTGNADKVPGIKVDAAQDFDPLSQAYSDGFAAGKQAVEADHQLQGEKQNRLRLAFRVLDQAAMDALSAEISETVISLCEQVVGELRIDRSTLSDRCRVAASRIGMAAADCKMYLNPDDIDLLGDDFLADWNVVAEPAIERGNLRFEGPDSSVRDGPAEWRRAIAEAVRS